MKKNPQEEITNGILKANLYLPDTENGYYRATRFDWSGIISNLEFNGHSFFGQWFEKCGLNVHDFIVGPVEAFDPIAYDETMPGDSFVIIGIGALVKSSDESYNCFNSYKIVDSGTWKTKKEANSILFIHKLNHDKFSYEYTKKIEFVKGKSEMVISHYLKNTGNKAIETQVFNHNFFVLDNQPTGPDFELTFPKNVSGTGRGLGDIAEIKGNKLVFNRTLVKGESVYCGSLKGINNRVEDYNIQLENIKAGVGVRIKGDRPISNMVFWCCLTCICPEPYIEIKVEPGKVFQWNYSYEFYQIPGCAGV